jgi:CHASE2 domain-containing sensor protein
MYGGIFFNLDQDGVFRHAKAFYKVKNGDSKEKKSTPPVPNLPITIASAYLGITQQSLEKILSDMEHHNIILKGDKNQTSVHIHMDNRNRITPNFIGNYRYFEQWQTDIDAILAQYGNLANNECIPGKNTKNISPPLKDKIVLLGGSYDERDFYITPVGPMAGMEVIANITQNIISGDLIKHTARWWAFAIEIFLGTIVALIFILTSRFRATVICFTTLIPVVSIASMLTFSTTYHWFDFVPTISGVTFHGWISKVEQDIKSAKQILGKIAEERKI